MTMNCQICMQGVAKFGFKKEKIKKFCTNCAKTVENCCNLTVKLCEEEECRTSAGYNFRDANGKRFCSAHKQPGMIDKAHPLCIYVDENGTHCEKNPSRGFAGEKAKYCEPHSKFFDNIEIISSGLCKWKNGDEKCFQRASFNIQGKKTGVYCKKHKEENMIFVLSCNKCIEPGCKTRPSYNYLTEKERIYCSKHKKPDMYNIADKRCDFEGCIQMATCNFTDQTKSLYCCTHKLPDMVNIRSKKCEYPYCNTEPSCNVEGETIKRFCAKHKEPGMVNVKNRKCKEAGCRTEASCNFIGETKRLYCCLHRKTGMFDISTKRCKNIEGGYVCETRENKLYDGYCVRCFVGLFPFEKKTRNYKTKELKVCEYIQENFQDFTISFDKVITDGCSKRRPDMYIDMGSHSVIIEVDENQHDTYENICENKRFMQIFTDLGNRPMILIRFNPDEYINDKKEKIKSCWSKSKDGLAIINRNQRDQWQIRLQKLKEAIYYHINNKPQKEIEITRLYFDEL